MSAARLIRFDSAAWPALSELLDQWLDLEPEARAGWLESLGPEYDRFKPALLDLLGAQPPAGAGDFLDRLPAIGDLEKPLLAGFTAGMLIGPYRLIRELGYGGMGVVWLAEPSDGGLKRPIALKLPFLAAQGVLAERFDRERDILAQLTHPHIARLYDAGTAGGSQPYLALEYVDGEAVTAYCDHQRLGVRPRLRLFLDVLAAVQYAHTNLVIHRDLKPSNILVTHEGEVRLLDFGIARLLTEGKAQDTQLTWAGGRVLTPDYASPEQIAGEPLTTASDVYSLGVVLYELLTGERPYRLKRDTRGGLEEAIVSALPVKPGQAVKDEQKAQARSSNAKRLARELRGDLDTIVLKALQKQPQQRYPTVEAFARDIERHLCGEAVLARPENLWYRTWKFAGRNRLAVGAAASVAVALSVGLAVAVRQAQIARVESRTAQAAQAFLEDIFRANSSQNPDPLKARQTTARQLLDLGATRLDADLGQVPAAKIPMMAIVAQMYQYLGLKEEANALLESRVQLARRIYGPYDRHTAEALADVAINIAESSHASGRAAVIEEAARILDRNRDYTSLTRALIWQATAREYLFRDPARALNAARRAVTLMRAFPPSDNLVQALSVEGFLHTLREENQEAVRALSEALRISQSLKGKANGSLAQLYAQVANAQFTTLDWRGAEEGYRLALQAARSINGDEHEDVIQTEMRLGYFLVRAAKPVEGLNLLRNALELSLRIKGPDDTMHTGQAQFLYGLGLTIRGRPSDGLDRIQRGVAVYRHAGLTGDRTFAGLLDGQALCEVKLGHYAEAARLLEESSAIDERNGGLFAGLAYQSFVPRTDLLIATGRAAEAARMLDGFAARAGAGDMSSARLPFALSRAGVELARGDYDRAIQMAAEVRSPVENSASRAYLKRYELAAALVEGKALVGAGRAAEALRLLETAAALGAEIYDPETSPDLATVQAALGDCLARLGDVARARAFLTQARRIHAHYPGVRGPSLRPLRDYSR
jgi:serine/threonine protein kinase